MSNTNFLKQVTDLRDEALDVIFSAVSKAGKPVLFEVETYFQSGENGCYPAQMCYVTPEHDFIGYDEKADDDSSYNSLVEGDYVNIMGWCEVIIGSLCEMADHISGGNLLDKHNEIEKRIENAIKDMCDKKTVYPKEGYCLHIIDENYDFVPCDYVTISKEKILDDYGRSNNWDNQTPEVSAELVDMYFNQQ